MSACVVVMTALSTDSSVASSSSELRMSAATLSKRRMPDLRGRGGTHAATLTVFRVLAQRQADARALSAGDDEAPPARAYAPARQATEVSTDAGTRRGRLAVRRSKTRSTSRQHARSSTCATTATASTTRSSSAAARPGRFGGSYLRAMGGRALIIDRWPFLGGSCPHQACVPHHLFSEAAALLDRARWFSDELFFPPFDAVAGEHPPARRAVPRRPRSTAHAFMNWQTQVQLDVEFVLNAEADDPRREHGRGRRAHVRGAQPRHRARREPEAARDARARTCAGVHDWATLVEDLDYEPDALRDRRRRQDRGRVRLVLPVDGLRDDDRLALAGDAHAQPAPRRRGHPPLRRRRHAARAA